MAAVLPPPSEQEKTAYKQVTIATLQALLDVQQADEIVLCTDLFDDVDDTAAVLSALADVIRKGKPRITAIIASNPRYDHGIIDIDSLGIEDRKKVLAILFKPDDLPKITEAEQNDAIAKARAEVAALLQNPARYAELSALADDNPEKVKYISLLRACKAIAPVADNLEIRSALLKQYLQQAEKNGLIKAGAMPPIINLGGITAQGEKTEAVVLSNARLLERCTGFKLTGAGEEKPAVVAIEPVTLAGGIFSANRSGQITLTEEDKQALIQAQEKDQADKIIAIFQQAKRAGKAISLHSIGSFADPVKVFRILLRTRDSELLQYFKVSSYMGFSMIQKTGENNFGLSPGEAVVFFNECIDKDTIGVLADTTRMQTMKIEGLPQECLDNNGVFQSELSARYKASLQKKLSKVEENIKTFSSAIEECKAKMAELSRQPQDPEQKGAAEAKQQQKLLEQQMEKSEKDLEKNQKDARSYKQSLGVVSSAEQRMENPPANLPAEEQIIYNALAAKGAAPSANVLAQPKFFRMLAYMFGEEHLKHFTANYKFFMCDTLGKYRDFRLHDVFNVMLPTLLQKIKDEQNPIRQQQLLQAIKLTNVIVIDEGCGGLYVCTDRKALEKQVKALLENDLAAFDKFVADPKQPTIAVRKPAKYDLKDPKLKDACESYTMAICDKLEAARKRAQAAGVMPFTTTTMADYKTLERLGIDIYALMMEGYMESASPAFQAVRAQHPEVVASYVQANDFQENAANVHAKLVEHFTEVQMPAEGGIKELDFIKQALLKLCAGKADLEQVVEAQMKELLATLASHIRAKALAKGVAEQDCSIENIQKLLLARNIRMGAGGVAFLSNGARPDFVAGFSPRRKLMSGAGGDFKGNVLDTILGEFGEEMLAVSLPNREALAAQIANDPSTAILSGHLEIIEKVAAGKQELDADFMRQVTAKLVEKLAKNFTEQLDKNDKPAAAGTLKKLIKGSGGYARADVQVVAQVDDDKIAAFNQYSAIAAELYGSCCAALGYKIETAQVKNPASDKLENRPIQDLVITHARDNACLTLVAESSQPLAAVATAYNALEKKLKDKPQLSEADIKDIQALYQAHKELIKTLLTDRNFASFAELFNESVGFSPAALSIFFDQDLAEEQIDIVKLRKQMYDFWELISAVSENCYLAKARLANDKLQPVDGQDFPWQHLLAQDPNLGAAFKADQFNAMYAARMKTPGAPLEFLQQLAAINQQLAPVQQLLQQTSYSSDDRKQVAKTHAALKELISTLITNQNFTEFAALVHFPIQELQKMLSHPTAAVIKTKQLLNEINTFLQAIARVPQLEETLAAMMAPAQSLASRAAALGSAALPASGVQPAGPAMLAQQQLQQQQQQELKQQQEQNQRAELDWRPGNKPTAPAKPKK